MLRYRNFFCFLLTVNIFNISFAQDKERLTVNGITFDRSLYPVVVIGSGPAGLTAANICAQAGIPCMVIQGKKEYGTLGESPSVLNWPGRINATGKEIVGDIKKQATSVGAVIKEGEVIRVNLQKWPREIEYQDLKKTWRKRIVKALAVIIATGIDIDMEPYMKEKSNFGYWQLGVGVCPVCEASLYRGNNVGMVERGDRSLIDAAYLVNIVKHLYIFTEKSTWDVSSSNIYKRDQLLKRSNVTFVPLTKISGIGGNGKKLTHVITENVNGGVKNQYDLSGLLLNPRAYTPDQENQVKANTEFLRRQVALDRDGFIVRFGNGMKTSVEGVFAAGSVCDSHTKAVTAASDGFRSGVEAVEFLQEVDFSVDLLS